MPLPYFVFWRKKLFDLFEKYVIMEGNLQKIRGKVMRRKYIAGLLALLMCLSLFCGCGNQQPEYTTQSTQQQTQPVETTAEVTTAATTLPEETTEPEPTWADPDFEIQSSHIFVYDSALDKIIFSKGGLQEAVSPASLTKLYSAYVALQYLDPAAEITVGEEVTMIDPDSSVAHIYQGQKISVEMCVEGMLLQSGNDAAYILAVAAGRAISQNPDLSTTAAIGIFAGKMNELALEFGMENTHFTNPDGIDSSGHYTSMQDLLTISLLAMEQPLIRKYAQMATDNVTYLSGETASWKNTNELLHPQSQFYCPEAIGLKTGSTQNAGKCLISAFQKEDGYLIVGVLGCPESQQRYVDTLHLYQHFTDQPIEEYILETTPTE